MLKFAKLLKKHPMLLNSLIYGSFYTGAELAQQSYNAKSKSQQCFPKVSDPISQRLHEWNKVFGLDEDRGRNYEGYNWAQLKRYAIYGCVLAGPVLHVWYKWLDSFYKGSAPNVIVKKLIADQFVLTPPLIITFFISMSLMESKPDVTEECRSKFSKTFRTSCVYWIPIQCVNFVLVPPTFRVLYVSVAAFCWVNILCYFKSLPAKEIT